MVERMQLLYGNDGTNYHTIASSKNMTAVQEKELLESYLGYDFVKDSSLYSDVSREPVSITYVTTDLSNTLEREKILIAKNARMKNYLTPSYYAHFQLMEMSEELYGERFMELLQYSFIEDTGLQMYEDRDIDSFHPSVSGMPVSSDAIDKESLVPIIASVLDAADSISKQVNIVLDVTGDAYNRRALEVIATIYKYLPYNIRKKVGFTTYAKTGSASSGRVKVKLYTRDALDKLGKSAIDLQNMDTAKVLGKLPDMAVNLAKDFVQQNDAQREEWFESFQTVFQLKNISVEEHISFFKNLRSWQNDDLEKIKDSIAKYAILEAGRKPESPVFTMFKNIISKRFQKEGFLARYWEIIKQLLMKNESFSYDNRLKAYIMLGEVLTSVQFIPNIFVEWENEKIIRKEEDRYEDMELYTKLRIQYQAVHDMRCGRDKFRMIQTVMEDNLKRYLEELKEQILQNMEIEKQDITQFFEAQRMTLENLPFIANRFVHIKYKDNKTVLKKALYEKMVYELNSIAYFRSLADFQRYMKMLEEYGNYLQEEDGQNLTDIAKHKGEIVETMEKIKIIDWNDKTDVLRTYRNIADMKSVSEGKMVDVPEFVLHIGRDSFTLSSEKLEKVVEFLFVPTDRNAREFEYILQKMPGMLDSIYEINVFGEEHFCYLMEMAKAKKEEQKQALKYYLSGDALLSPEKIKIGLYQVETDVLNNLRDDMGKNILGTVIQNKLMIRGDKNEKRVEGKNIEVNEYEEKGINISLILLLSVIIPMLAFVLVFFMSSIVEFSLLIMLIISLVLIFISLICLLIPKNSNYAKVGCIGCGIGAGLSIFAVWAWYLLFCFKF